MSTTEKNLIALYLGESYATLKVFNQENLLLSKNVFLPQVNLKNLLQNVKKSLPEGLVIHDAYIVCRYFDRLKNFRLGGSVVQVVAQGFENSYQVSNTNNLSLAASALMISLKPKFTIEELTTEFQRVKKINSDANKVVITLPEYLYSANELSTIHDFFAKESFKVFCCTSPFDFKSLRKTLLNAGSQGTKDEITEEFKEIFHSELQVHFWVNDRFTQDFENVDLYASSLCFLDDIRRKKKLEKLYFFDSENWFLLTGDYGQTWHSPWGEIDFSEKSKIPTVELFSLSPYSELTFNSLGEWIIHNQVSHEPGPFIAGRSTKTLLIDLFYEELSAVPYYKEIFQQLSAPTLQQKLNNHFQVLERGQSFTEIAQTKESLKHLILLKIEGWMAHCKLNEIPILSCGFDFLFNQSSLNKNKKLIHVDLCEEIRNRVLS